MPPRSDYEVVKAWVDETRQRGWPNEPDPVQIASGNWVAAGAKILTYHPKRPNKKYAVPFIKSYESVAEAQEHMRQLGIDHYNLYRFSPVDGWRTDW